MILRNLCISNFKGCKHRDIDFHSDLTEIFGANATGKTTILDALWWLLFNKDSQGSEKFEVRPLDASGEKIHHVDISVEATFEVITEEGKKTVILKKTSSEKWTTKRGAVSAELTGNVNTYEIDGFEKKESEYKAFINSLIEEKLFKMLSNPMYFPSLPWKEQREILMLLVEDMPDAVLASQTGGYEDIIDDLGKASLDDIAQKYRKEMSGLKDKQKEIPVRIDEISMQKASVDVEALEKEKQDLMLQVLDLDKLIHEGDATEQIKAINADIAALQAEQVKLLEESRNEYHQKRSYLTTEISMVQQTIRLAKAQIAESESDEVKYKSFITSNKTLINQLLEEWKSEKAVAFDGDTNCPYCGQPLPENMVEDAKAKFEEKKQARLDSIVVKGKALSEENKRLEENIENAAGNAAKAQRSLLDAEAKEDTLRKELDALKEPEIPSRCIQIDDEIDAKKAVLESLGKSDTTSDYQAAMDGLKERIKAIDAELAKDKANELIDARITELTAELREVAQKSLDVEKKMNQLETFVRFKMERVSSIINSYFDGVEFRLFTTQLNQGIKETCECTVNGVPYASVNSGHKILAGMSIISALQKRFGVYVPVWLDNAESLSSFNLPTIDTQLITLSVSDDKELVVR